MSLDTTHPSPAEIYDRKFVPALFGPWGPVICEIAGIRPGMAVLDVGCGTGALTLAAAERAGPGGAVVGLDANPEMLAVARAKPTGIDWREGTAEDLPFESDRFDAVVSQFAFMFFGDRPKALQEMRRVARPGAAVAVAVCGDLAASPGYSALAALLDRLFGRDVGDAFRAPFVLGDAGRLGSIADAAGIAAAVDERRGAVVFDSIDELVATERACVWTLGGILDDDQFETLLRESRSALEPFRRADGRVVFDMPALVLRFRKA